MNYQQFVFFDRKLPPPQWRGTCSCGFKSLSLTQDAAQQNIDEHKSTHEAVDEVTLSNARSEYLDAFSNLNHVGAGMADRVRRFHAAWSNLNLLKRKNGQATVDATKPRVK